MCYCAAYPQVRHNHDALTKLIHLAHAVPKLAALISNSNTPEPVRLGATRLLAALMSTQEDGRTQVRAVSPLLFMQVLFLCRFHVSAK